MMALLALGTWAARPLAQRLVPGGGGWCPAVLIGLDDHGLGALGLCCRWTDRL